MFSAQTLLAFLHKALKHGLKLDANLSVCKMSTAGCSGVHHRRAYLKGEVGISSGLHVHREDPMNAVSTSGTNVADVFNALNKQGTE